jgi:hypothetical protein
MRVGAMRGDLRAALKIGQAMGFRELRRQADCSTGDNAAKNAKYDLVEELEAAVAHKNMRDRAEMFRRVAVRT